MIPPSPASRPLVAVNGRFLAQTAPTGVQRYAREMVRALAGLSTRLRVVVLAPRDAGPAPVPGLLRDRSRLTGVPWELMRLSRLARAVRADLLWCPANTAPLFTGGLPLVVTIHDAAVWAHPGWFSPWFRWYYRLLPLAWRQARRLITVSAFSRAELLRLGLVPRRPDIAVIPCGLTRLPAEERPGPRPPALPPRTPYLLALGSGNPRKNTARLLEAWAAVPPAVKRGRLLVVIAPPSRPYAREPRRPPAPDVLFLDYVSEAGLAALYRDAEVFVYPSLYEGFGMPPLEAMAAGAPVLAAAAASLPEVCGPAALYCDPADTADMTAKLVRILTDAALREALRRQGRKRVPRFSWETSARQLLELFQELLAPPGGASGRGGGWPPG